MTENNFEQIFADLVDDKIEHDRAKKILLAMNEGGFSAEMFIAAVKVLKSRMKSINTGLDLIDVCGTGGDGLQTLNVSTAVCFVLAACGLRVAKHGNKAISSKSGSADIFNELGIEVGDNEDQLVKNLQNHKLSFLFAPLFHKSLKNIANLRLEIAKEHKIPTIFNYLGPLLNPANAKTQLIGVSNRKIMQQMAIALSKDKDVKAYFVHGFDGMDELTICDNSYLIKVENGEVFDEIIVNPEDYGFNKVSLSQIEGKDPKHNAEKLISLLDGEKSAYRDIVLLNAAFALELAGKVNSIKEGVELASKAIDDGAAKSILANFHN